MPDERFLRVARALALLPPIAGCAAEPAPTPVAPIAAPSSSTKVATEDERATIVQGDPTEGSGKCRCSWDTNTGMAARVCKKGEIAYGGNVCQPGTRPKYPIAIGPLPPPDLAA